MATLSDKDKRTLRIALIGVAIYLALFFGFKAWRNLEKGRASYQQLVVKAQREEQAVRRMENDVMRFEKLTGEYRFDPRQLSKETLVAQAAAAIQNAARQGGLQLGPMRETPGRAGARELSTFQFDGMGQLPAALTLLHKLQTLGYPIVIDSLQLTQEKQPGMLKFNVTVVILNFEPWQKGATPNA